MASQVSNVARRLALAGVLAVHAGANAGVYSQGICHFSAEQAAERLCADWKPTGSTSGSAYCSEAVQVGTYIRLGISDQEVPNGGFYAYSRIVDGCENKDFAYLWPVVVLFFGTMMVIYCSKVIRRMFTRETA